MGNNAEYISVSELSKRVGKSKQWIYKLIKNDPDFRRHIKTVGGITMVETSVITEFFSHTQEIKPDVQQVEILKEQVAYLKKQYDDLMKLFEREQYFRAQEKAELAEIKLLIADLQSGRTEEPEAAAPAGADQAATESSVMDDPAGSSPADQERTVTEEPATAPDDPAGGGSEADQGQAVTDQADGPEQITAPEVPEQANTPERDMTTETAVDREQAIAPEEPGRKAAPEDAALVGKTTFWSRLKWLLFGE